MNSNHNMQKLTSVIKRQIHEYIHKPTELSLSDNDIRIISSILYGRIKYLRTVFFYSIGASGQSQFDLVTHLTYISFLKYVQELQKSFSDIVDIRWSGLHMPAENESINAREAEFKEELKSMWEEINLEINRSR